MSLPQTPALNLQDWYPFKHLDRERHSESQASCSRIQRDDANQGSRLGAYAPPPPHGGGTWV